MKLSAFPQPGMRMAATRIIEWIAHARLPLAQISDTPNLECELLVAHVKQRDRSWVITHSHYWLETTEERSLQALLERRLCGEPLPYLLGEWEFFGRKFKVNRSVLIPRPETEILLEESIAWLKAHPGARTAIDIGTGSGAIAVSLAAEVPDLIVTATDISPEALRIASENAENHGVSNRIEFLACDLFPEADGLYNLVCANLPYIPTQDLGFLPEIVREPALALDGGLDGLEIIRRLIGELPKHILQPALALLEMQFDQSERVLKFTQEVIPSARITILKDLAKHPRVARIEIG